MMPGNGRCEWLRMLLLCQLGFGAGFLIGYSITDAFDNDFEQWRSKGNATEFEVAMFHVNDAEWKQLDLFKESIGRQKGNSTNGHSIWTYVEHLGPSNGCNDTKMTKLTKPGPAEILILAGFDDCDFMIKLKIAEDAGYKILILIPTDYSIEYEKVTASDCLSKIDTYLVDSRIRDFLKNSDTDDRYKLMPKHLSILNVFLTKVGIFIGILNKNSLTIVVIIFLAMAALALFALMCLIIWIKVMEFRRRLLIRNGQSIDDYLEELRQTQNASTGSDSYFH